VSTGKDSLTGPGGDNREIVFGTYTPLNKPKNPGLFGLAPPDMSGADSPLNVVLYTGNTYLAASKNSGVSFQDLDSSTFLPKIPGRAADQVITYVPALRSQPMVTHGIALDYAKAAKNASDNLATDANGTARSSHDPRQYAR
jgi:hypothetical protein